MPEDQHLSSEREVILEEFRQVVEDRRYVMTRYIQAVGLYLALAAFALKELVSAPSLPLPFLTAALHSTLNILAFYAARQFKRMALHYWNRETALARHLSMQGPSSLLWGYTSGIVLVSLIQLAVLAVAVIRSLQSSGDLHL